MARSRAKAPKNVSGMKVRKALRRSRHALGDTLCTAPGTAAVVKTF